MKETNQPKNKRQAFLLFKNWRIRSTSLCWQNEFLTNKHKQK